MSPTVLTSGPYRFFFFSSDRPERPHIHVARERRTAKFWLEPVREADNHGFNPTELGRIAVIINKHQSALVEAWHEYLHGGN